MAKFNIFYSWQSDLPANTTRNFIRSCIDRAIGLAYETDAIDAERDEATNGLTGAPNIVISIFDKIDECDLFIADLSLCYKEDRNGVKRSPNPNVLIELGYAVKVLGWERVICLCNINYGKDYPFDIAHNRITTFSVDEKNKENERKRIAGIIADNISNLQNEPPRAKKGMAAYIIGSYDFESKCVESKLRPIDITHQKSFIFHNGVLLQEAKKLVVEIDQLSKHIKKSIAAGSREHNENCQENSDNVQFAVRLMADSFRTETTVEYKDEDAERDKESIKRLLGVDVQEDFFDLGTLKKTVNFLGNSPTVYSGTEEEKSKYEKLQELSGKLARIDLRNDYINTFVNMLFIPIAIKNNSRVNDENITIHLQVINGKSIIPDKNLIWEEFEGLQHFFCREDDDEDPGIICELFRLDEDETIHIDNTIFDIPAMSSKIPVLTQYGLQVPDKTEEDYENELKEFLAVPADENRYEFEVRNIRPGECKWLSKGILVQPDQGRVKVSYHIISQNTDGNISGEIEYTVQETMDAGN